MKKFTRRAALLGAGGAAGWTLSRAFGPNLPVYDGTRRIASGAGETTLNDASGLSPTPIHKHIVVKQDPDDALIAIVRQELAAARKDGRPLNVGAARHSMGGQAIPRNGTAITFDNGSVELDSASRSYRAHAGARWSQVINALDPAGFSPAVMQSNHDFGVAATFSVNAHGWPVPFGPMGSTVRSLRMVMPDGELVTCSRSENTDLFNLAMGGYGLIGVIVDLEVDMVPNSRLAPQFDVIDAPAFADAFDAVIRDPDVTMAYGRLNVERESFFTKALLVSYRETPDQAALPPASGSGWMAHAASRIYRAQLGNERMKAFRWWNETAVGPALGGGEVTRNTLINEPVMTLDDRNPDRTDILHEYFVGFDRFGEFLTACRDVIPASYQEFLNVTLRYVAQDDQSMLSYAKVPRIAAVMSFSQEMTIRGEADMARMTRDLIDRIAAIDGAYYLPYRPHATVAQLSQTYENAVRFSRAKRDLDPDLVLRNNLWDSYLGQL
ncbi:FAD-binding oxidoreductase [Sulfitobacter sp. G21635-S1]|uniref:FAD-binding oxidoreductase n=1 Tax=Sulfitobacter sp. G21635-S1 TaxID=3014043 RepID=UPI0022AF1A0E|nr:FAD-binding oxidoreductase [Sulfitobacter sp. G21635-S1]MCZ4253965.1 FAD-binding oxidoreductase [Sulfitobacter sp. G21635-S1]